jgi:beta-lactamase class A
LARRTTASAIERRADGRLGVAVIEAGKGLARAHRADERLPMCSTFELLASAGVLKLVEQGRRASTERLPMGPPISSNTPR